MEERLKRFTALSTGPVICRRMLPGCAAAFRSVAQSAWNCASAEATASVFTSETHSAVKSFEPSAGIGRMLLASWRGRRRSALRRAAASLAASTIVAAGQRGTGPAPTPGRRFKSAPSDVAGMWRCT
eukprot:1801310-Pleurochrysis_carterae.AAC.1